MTNRDSVLEGVRRNSMTPAQLISVGELAKNQPASAAWFASYFGEEGDPDLYLQDLTREGALFRIARDGAITPSPETFAQHQTGPDASLLEDRGTGARKDTP